MVSQAEPRLVNCEECGRAIEEDSHFCQYCGHMIAGEGAKAEEERKSAEMERSLMPIGAGILILVASLLLLYTVWISRYKPGFEGNWLLAVVYEWPSWYQILMTLSAIVGVVGAISALLRKSQVIALIGAALSTLGFGAPLGLIGLLLVATSEHQFASELSDFTKPVETIETRRIEGLEFERRV